MNQEIDPRLTPFQKKVYEACRQIPKGKVSTYGSLARRIGCGSAQAVGQALRVNPFAPEVPCHRVVKSDGSPGGFFGHAAGPEVLRKLALLKSEGVELNSRDRIDPGYIWEF
ncbi:MGMT family protein [Kiritimatiellaeota bacterium B1221]|nr:MGMT family protein [Kiritimatiellaeota bacterium B1221]